MHLKNKSCIYNFYSSKVLATVYDIHSTYVKQKVVFSFDNVLANPVENYYDVNIKSMTELSKNRPKTKLLVLFGSLDPPFSLDV